MVDKEFTKVLFMYMYVLHDEYVLFLEKNNDSWLLTCMYATNNEKLKDHSQSENS